MVTRPAADAVVVAKAMGRASDPRRTVTAAMVQILRGCVALFSRAARSPQPNKVATTAAGAIVPSPTVEAAEWGKRTPRCTPAAWVTRPHAAAAATEAAATVT
jgi:hypothetical protein